jgi:hypothetical protein
MDTIPFAVEVMRQELIAPGSGTPNRPERVSRALLH